MKEFVQKAIDETNKDASNKPSMIKKYYILKLKQELLTPTMKIKKDMINSLYSLPSV